MTAILPYLTDITHRASNMSQSGPKARS